MKATIKTLNQRPGWKALAAHHKQVQNLHLRKLFADDAKRGERFTTEAAGLFLDYSKNCITEKTLKLLVQLAKESNLRGRIDAMFGGEKINVTENRAVLEGKTTPKLKHDSSTNNLICCYRKLKGER